MGKNLTRAIIAAGILSMAAPNADAGLRQWMHNSKNAVVRMFGGEAKPVCGGTVAPPCAPAVRMTRPPARKTAPPVRHDSSLDRIVDYRMGVVGGFCEPGNQVRLVLPDLTDAQIAKGYTLRYEMAGKPKFSWLADNSAIDLVEMTSGALNANDRRYVHYSVSQSDGINTYTLKLPKEHFALVLRDGNGRRVDTRHIGATFTTGDCIYVKAESTAEATVGSAEARAEVTVMTPTETVTATAEASAGAGSEYGGYRDFGSARRRKPLANAGNWEANVGVGSLEHNFQTGYWRKIDGKEKLIRYEESYTGSQLMGQLKYTDDNTLFSVQAASSRGDNGAGNRYYNTPQSTVTAFSPSFNWEETFGHSRARIGIGIDGSYSSVTFGEGVGLPDYYGDTTVMRYRSVDGYGNLIGMIGYQDGSHLKLKAGYGAQRINFGRPNNSTANDRRSDGVVEKMWKAEIGGQLYVIDDHARIFATVRAMAPQTERSTNWKEIIDDSTVFNGEGGVEWIFNPGAKNPFGISGRGKYGQEDTVFEDGVPFRSSDIGFGFFGHYRF